jgi:hypothetical protein
MPSIPLSELVSAMALATNETAEARKALRDAELRAVPRIVAAMGRPMGAATEAAWLAAVDVLDVLALRRLAIAHVGERPGHAPGPHVPLLRAIASATGQALALRDVGAHFAERGSLPCRAAALARSES